MTLMRLCSLILLQMVRIMAQVADTAKIIENECPVGNDDLYGGVDEGDIKY